MRDYEAGQKAAAQLMTAVKDIIFIVEDQAKEIARLKALVDERPCTCHPDDNPPVPCAKKFAYTECMASVEPTEEMLKAAEEAVVAEWDEWMTETGLTLQPWPVSPTNWRILRAGWKAMMETYNASARS